MKLQHGIVFNSTSGKFGGSVVSRSRFGAVLRTRSRQPVRISTHFSKSRYNYSIIYKTFNSLSFAGRRVWADRAKSSTGKNVFGATYVYSTYQYYFQVQQVRLMSGNVLISTPGAIGALHVFSSVSLSASVAGSSCTLTYSPALTTSQFYFIYFSIPVSPSKSPNTVRFLFCGSISSVNASPFNLFSLYSSRVNVPLVAGNILYCKLVSYRIIAGQKSAPVILKCVIT